MSLALEETRHAMNRLESMFKEEMPTILKSVRVFKVRSSPPPSYWPMLYSIAIQIYGGLSEISAKMLRDTFRSLCKASRVAPMFHQIRYFPSVSPARTSILLVFISTCQRSSFSVNIFKGGELEHFTTNVLPYIFYLYMYT